MYLVTEADGTICYRIPLPIGSGVSTGEALPTLRLPDTFDVEDELIVKVREQTKASMGISGDGGADSDAETDSCFTDYVPTGPFNGKHSFETKNYKYTYNFNEDILAFVYLHLLSSPYVGYAENKDELWNDYITQLAVTDNDFETYYQNEKNRYDSNRLGRINYLIEGVEEVVIAGITIKYFACVGEGIIQINGTLYNFHVELEEGVYIQGGWVTGDNADKRLDTFEKFLMEMFYAFEITPKTEP